MNKPRPKNLNLFTIRQPLPAIVSILHRITGILLFLFLPAVLWGLRVSLSSREGFEEVQDFFSEPVMKFILWGMLAAFIYHLIAGIRHILMDMGWGSTLKVGRLTSFLTLLFSIVLIVWVGIKLW